MTLTRRTVVTGLLAMAALPLTALADDLPRNIERLTAEQVRAVIVGKKIKLGEFFKKVEIREDGTYFSDYGAPQLPTLKGKWTITKKGVLRMKATGGSYTVGDYALSRVNGKYMQQAVDAAGNLSPVFKARPLL